MLGDHRLGLLLAGYKYFLLGLTCQARNPVVQGAHLSAYAASLAISLHFGIRAVSRRH